MATAIIVAAGKGIRMNRAVPKQYLMLGNRPVLCHTILAFDGCALIDDVLLVVPESDFHFCHTRILAILDLQKKVRLVAGGESRQDSVYNGLLAVEHKEGGVLIHDGVRPFIRQELLSACVHAVMESGACIPGLPAVDTLKVVNSAGFIDKTLTRNAVWLAQTPQAFEFSLIKKAHENARKEGYSATDDAALVERMGEKIQVIKGSRWNIKITTPQDMELALAIFTAGLV
jgi:2-C-methyl-D-erythritol 4-phosphate cytidylyltransferase